VQVKGHKKSEARGIAISVLKRSGVLGKGLKLTSKGKKRQAMGRAGRAKDRAASRSGNSKKKYAYNERTNRAVLKKKTKKKKKR